MIHRNVTTQREGKYWLVFIDGANGLTQARRFSEIETMAREYVALVEDTQVGNVIIDTITVSGISEALAQAAADRQTASALEAAATQSIRDVARKLRSESVPLAEIGQILGVSHQRAAQLLQAA